MSNNNNRQALKRYQTGGHKRVDGWLAPEAITIISTIAAIQDTLEIRRSVAEIGIHHDRLFILLCLLSAPNERGHAYDLFEQQEENADRSGRGDLEHFIANLARHGCPVAHVEIHAGNSLQLSAEQVSRQLQQPARLFSVDSGHSAENTYHDISLACQSLCDGGVLILDDYFNQDWPAVSEGGMNYVIDHPETLFPLVIGGNKLLLTNDQTIADRYREALTNTWRPWRYKPSEFLGSPVLIFSSRDRMVRYLKHSAIGSHLRGSKRVEQTRSLQRRLFGS